MIDPIRLAAEQLSSFPDRCPHDSATYFSECPDCLEAFLRARCTRGMEALPLTYECPCGERFVSMDPEATYCAPCRAKDDIADLAFANSKERA